MWKKFLQWLREEGKGLRDAEYDDVVRFLDESKHREVKGLEKRQRYRYIRLIERVFDHLSELGLRQPNPARLAALKGASIGDNDDSRFLDKKERRAVFAFLKREADKSREVQKDKIEWIGLRDAAMIGAMIGGGLKVGQVQGVTVNYVVGVDQVEGNLAIDLPPRRGLAVAHRAPVLPFAHAILRQWLRAADGSQGPEGRLLFPAERHFGPRAVPVAHLSAVQIFRRTQTILAACGVTGDRACPQTLRNTYAAILMESGANNETLMTSLGIIKERSCKRLRASHRAWMERQFANPKPRPAAGRRIESSPQDAGPPPAP